MYADRVEAETRRSIKDRLNGSFRDDSTRRRQVTGKRYGRGKMTNGNMIFMTTMNRKFHVGTKLQLHATENSFLSFVGSQYVFYFRFDSVLMACEDHKVDARDLRLKLQRKSQQASVSGKGSQSGTRDLREKLSGTMHPQPVNYDPPKPKLEATKPARKSVAIQASAPESKKASTSVDEFLQSLGLEKYSITFQAEEVDMTALTHMTDEDLKAIGIPMGPRKKILLALESRT
ncbi:Mitogen-activated protein kinase kinase kinase [Trema orientale]|uniref:Mitogen-activated protein kinase kinase kinase n=1 Tax=Trema orientale TaxID=63057 RepID=A0A2P5CEG8_TREOI|nr:Mitogen-activated protein kinase kinase kinase [Trema orientale]